ncbi:PREDICTED: rust resistance kinase Lr10-like [Nicotiana attenuata]|uniref:Rust resistance kinase lr10 n=1 Tax=Nicotiana attenuata TaxID=49451 RepID=A0A1J6J7G8_NICAT|nr:PREDICTED: rust resistance kinase Lr10-like [Nicotiana attenuata]OIT08576.1 rust resistance kinase lr10 [Nicotiana attenuata]
MTIFFLLHLLLIIMVFFAMAGEGTYDCRESRCGSDGPSIHFPFRIQHQPEYCGYPGFELFCDSKNKTILTLSNSVRLSVEEIDYMSQQIRLYDPESCLILKILHLNLSTSPFFFTDEADYSIFKCSGIFPADYLVEQPCASDKAIFAIESSMSLGFLPTATCKKILEIPSVPFEIAYNYVYLHWSNPECRYCEGLGKDCGFKNYTKQLRTQCLDRPSTTKAGTLKKPLIAGGVLGLILLGIIMLALYEFYSSSKIERENQARVEKFLEDYRALRPTRYTYADLKKVTNLFQERLGEGAYGVVYKGTLSNEIHVAVKVLNDSIGNGEEFINEVAAMGKIHHFNVVRLVGYCADGFKNALVYEYLPNQTLDKLIFPASSKDRIILNWKKLQDIAMGIAKGLEYLHQGCDQQILHFDIKPQNILLDQNLNPKISDFGLAKLCSKEKSVVTMTEARGTMGYIAPEVLSSNFGKASHKSDVYSFGMMLLEMVGGRKNFDAKANISQINFPEWIHQQLNQGEELKIRIEEDDDIMIVRKLAIIGLLCIQWNATDRPSIKVVTQMLEGDGSILTIPPPFTARYTTAGLMECPSSEELECPSNKWMLEFQ